LWETEEGVGWDLLQGYIISGLVLSLLMLIFYLFYMYRSSMKGSETLDENIDAIRQTQLKSGAISFYE